MAAPDKSLSAIHGGGVAGADVLQGTCARPGCSTLFTRPSGAGRPASFCSELCRREAQTERRRLRRRLAHHEDQAQQLRLLVAAYERSAADDEDESAAETAEFLAPDVVRAAEDAVLEMRVMTRFITDESGPYAPELVRFYEAVAPLIDYHCT
ncbi:hypothetical protein JCM18899A_27120 [Nocardioides sp. AN3]